MRSSTTSAILVAWVSAAMVSALAAISEPESASPSAGLPSPPPPPAAPPPSPQEGRKRVRRPPPPWSEANDRAHHDMGPSTKDRKPNIILILTDDQDVELGSLNFMPRTVRLLQKEGAEFRHAYVTTPMCCPSRSSLLTGLYVHNHQTFTNNDNCSSSTWQANFEPRSFATYLSNAGYRTGYFGKYLNKYNGSYIPPGWREWGGLVMNSRYYNYSVNMNGKRVRHGDDYHKDYYPDVIVNDSISFLRQSKQSFSRKPVLLVLSFPAPHGPEDSAPQFSDMFFNVTTHHTPTYDYAPNPDKQWILQATGKMKPIHRQFTDLLMTKRLQTLQSVDMGVQRVYEELKSLGELDNTYIVYTSDHGYHLGQFGLIKGKSFPFEFDVRVPFLLRGPDVDPGTIIDEIVLNIDLAPTFLDMAGVDPPPHMDGRSFLRLLQRRRRRLRWPDTFLIESSGRRETGETPSPTPSSSNVSSSGTTPEMDVQLDNRVAPSPASTPVGKHHRLATECQRPELRAPCRHNQKWHCVLENGRWRKHKCKLPAFSRPKSPDAKKCACFTPEGLMYTRFESEARRGVRTKSLDDVEGDSDTRRWKRKVDPAVVTDLERRFETKRRRRRSLDDPVESGGVDDIIDEVHKEINMWQTTRPPPETEQSPSPTTPSESLSLSIPSIDSANCSRLSNGSVRCDQNVYSDTKTWRLNREKIDQQIRFLRAQLVTLKDIRRHLREKRPHRKNGHPAGPLFDSSEEEGEGEEAEDEEDDDIVTGKTAGVEQDTVDEHKSPMDKHDENCGGKHHISPVDLNVGGSSLIPDHVKEHTCYCEPDIALRRADKEAARALRWRVKSERLRRKQRKLRRRAKLEKTCLSERMNCFTHDNEHWRTPPLWTAGPFCFCMNANNNTYSCLRTINATHNFLYCEFVTGLVTFYNLRIDPFEQWNRAHTLTPAESSFMRDQLAQLKACRGSRQCTVGSGSMAPTTSNIGHTTVLPAHLNRHPRTKRRRYYPQAGRNYRAGPFVFSGTANQ